MASDVQWPPRSPHEALLSSPSGRRRIRQYQNRTSPSPSPLKKASTTPNMHSIRGTIIEDDEDEEDEETLQLRLEALEARLKLKKLQQKKLRAASADSDHDEGSGPSSRPYSTLKLKRYDTSSIRSSPTRSKSSADIQVAVSPPRKQTAVPEARSPGRVLLGIDKGLTGKNISLRRFPGGSGGAQARGSTADAEDPFASNTLRRGASRNSNTVSSTPSIGSNMARDDSGSIRSKSFSERIAETRLQEKENRERQDRIRKQRSKGFGVQQQDLDAFKDTAIASTAAAIPKSYGSDSFKSKAGGFSRDEVLKAVNKPTEGLLHRSNTVSGVRNTRGRDRSPSDKPDGSRINSRTSTTTTERPRTAQKRRSVTPPSSSPQPHSPTSADSPLFETFSSTHLSKRLIPHSFLSNTLAQKHISLIPSLLATIKSPSYTIPDELEDDFVVFGIIASKSSPLSHKDAHKSTSAASTSLTEATDSEMNARGKYMVFTLTDLKWSLDLYLFTTAYTRFWKLTPGTLIAILNPSIMPPPPGKADTGRFSLVLNSSDDTILEIGTSRDLGWCKSVKRDGKVCGSWVDKRHTEHCEWHVDRVVETTRRGRMEVNGMSAPYAPGGKRGGRTGFWGGGRKGKKDEDGLLKEGPQWDRGTGSRYFIGPSTLGPGRSAASLLDAEGGPLERGGTKEERVRKRLAEREREREIARKLGQDGNGIGGEYLRLRRNNEKGDGAPGTTAAHDATNETTTETTDAASLGLLGNKAGDVHLSPLKKKRKAGGLVAEDDGARKVKKTRFVTARGIKEAGRESFGISGTVDEDDDELDIL